MERFLSRFSWREEALYAFTSLNTGAAQPPTELRPFPANQTSNRLVSAARGRGHGSQKKKAPVGDGGKFAEVWDHADMDAVMRQIG
jgi:hypothetical protein